MLVILLVLLFIEFLEFLGVELFKDFLVTTVQSIDVLLVLLDPVVGVLHYLLMSLVVNL